MRRTLVAVLAWFLLPLVVASLPAQALGPFAAKVHRICVDACIRQPPAGSMAAVADALVAELAQLAPGLSRTDLASATTDLYYLATFAGRDAHWQEQLLAHAERCLAADPHAVDGWAPVLVLRGLHSFQHAGRSGDEDAWCRLWRRAPSPKRYWLAIEAARSLVNHLRLPALADQELTAAIVELAETPAWGEAERAAIAAAVDLHLTMRDRPAAGSRDDAMGQLLLLRGFAREQLGSLLFARDDLLAAAELLDRTGNRHRRVNCDHNLAAVHLHLGRHDEALRLAESTCVAYREESSKWSASGVDGRDENGVLAMRKLAAQAKAARAGPGDEQAALAEFEALAAANLTETNFDMFASIAELRLRRLAPGGDDPAILSWLERLRRRLASRREQALAARVELLHAEYERVRGDLVAARHRLQQLAGLVAVLRHPLLELERASLLGQVELAAGDGEAALTAFAQAASTLGDVVREQQMWRRAGASSAFAARFQQTLAGARRAWELATANGDPVALLRRLYAVVQAFHGFESACAGGDPALVRGDDPEVLPLLQELRAAQLQHAALLARPSANPIAERRRTEQLAAAGRRIDQADAALEALARARVPELARRRAHDLAAVQRSLAPGELLVECCDAGSCAFAFLIGRDHACLAPLPSGASWDLLSTTTLAHIENGREDAAAAGLQRLAAALWPEGSAFAAALARPEVQRLLWSPEGRFAALPLAALPWQQAALGRHLAIVHCVSGDQLAHERATHRPRRDRTEWRLLAVGRPAAAPGTVQRLRRQRLVAHGDFPDLPESATEVRDVAACYASAAEAVELQGLHGDALLAVPDRRGARYHLLLGDAAAETGVLAAAADCDVLHFACHAAAEPGEPWLSFLVLALGPAAASVADGDDGLLRLSEWWRLRGPRELVVLSACRTAVATGGTHDVVGGLAWAAQMAGARRVLASLWSVEDTAARAFAVAFHQECVERGRGAAEALATVQRQAIAAGRPLRDWAGFVLWGEPE